ncbi:hypothetical protein PENTCL1PPCAC_12658, partial [Pristionchus entomophagus]
MTVLKDYETLIENFENTFNNDFAELYDVAQSMLSDMFDLASTLNATSSSLISDASKKKNEVIALNDALTCMVAGVLTPEECGEIVPDIPTTEAPEITTTIPTTITDEHTTVSLIETSTIDESSTPSSQELVPTDAYRTTRTDVTEPVDETTEGLQST